MDVEVPGRMLFTLEGTFPDVSKLAQGDVVGVTAILLTCSYADTHEFFRVGYYVNNAYSEAYPELIENPPA